MHRTYQKSILLLAFVSISLAIASPQHTRSSRWRGHGNICPHVKAGFPVALVTAQSERLSTHSWEFGTIVEALLELYNPSLSVFGADPFPHGDIPVAAVDFTAGLAYARPTIMTNDTTLIGGDGAAGDPAALGVAAIMIGQTEPEYFDAARRQAEHLLYTVPRFWNGAISQREDVPELWADFMYMAPPFLAYYAVATDDEELLEEVVRQCGLYRQVLQSNTTASYNGVWEHIIGPQSADTKLWSTGNGWAAGGLVRVLATVKKWSRCRHAKKLTRQLNGYIKEILDGARGADRSDGGLLRNYLNDTEWFGEISGTAMLTAPAYRAAVLSPRTFGAEYVDWADENRFAIAHRVNASGLVAPAINPLNWGDTVPLTSGSPEGQSFTALMYAAYRDCVCAGVCAASVPPSPTLPPPTSSAASSSMSTAPTGSASSSGSFTPTASPSSSLSTSTSPAETTYAT